MQENQISCNFKYGKCLKTGSTKHEIYVKSRYKVKVQIVYIDTESELKSAEKYVPLRDSVKNLLWASCVDLVMGRDDRVRESFEYSFKDGVATIFCELKPGSYSQLKMVKTKIKVFCDFRLN